MDRFDYEQQLNDERRQSKETQDWYSSFNEETSRIFKASRKAWDKWAESFKETK